MFIISRNFKNTLYGWEQLRKISDTFKDLTNGDIITLGTLRSSFEQACFFNSKNNKYPSTNLYIDGLNNIITYNVSQNEYFEFVINRQHGDVEVTWCTNIDYPLLFKIMYDSDNIWTISTTDEIKLFDDVFFNAEERGNINQTCYTFEQIRKKMCGTDHVLLYLVWSMLHRGLRIKTFESVLNDEIIISNTTKDTILRSSDVLHCIEINLKQHIKIKK